MIVNTVKIMYILYLLKSNSQKPMRLGSGGTATGVLTKWPATWLGSKPPIANSPPTTWFDSSLLIINNSILQNRFKIQNTI